MRPITFNHDDANNLAKGEIKPEDLASYVSVAIPQKAGILNVYQNACSATVTSVVENQYAILTFNKGYISIYGRLIYIEQDEQVKFNLPDSANAVNGSLGIRINLGESGANEVEWFNKTTALTTDNLFNNATGTYEFRIYDYTATSSSFTISNKTSEIINNLADYMKGANFITPATGDRSSKLATTQFVGNEFSNFFKRTDYHKTFKDGVEYQGTLYKIGGMVVVTGELIKPKLNSSSYGRGASYTIDWHEFPEYAVSGISIATASMGEMANITIKQVYGIPVVGGYTATSFHLGVAPNLGVYDVNRVKITYIVVGRAVNG